MTFASLDPKQIPAGTIYDLMVAAVQPRPIGFISTVSAAGHRNLAPYSFFMCGGANPPSLLYCPAGGRDGEPKDSLRNVEETGEFVANVVVRSMVEGMNATAFGYPHEFDEWTVSGFTAGPSQVVRPDRVLESPAQFECKLHQVIRHGSGPLSTIYVIGEIVWIHLREEIWNGGSFDRSALRAVGRMGGAEYIDTACGELFEMPRPQRAADPSESG